jgi:hypothetical protein
MSTRLAPDERHENPHAEKERSVSHHALHGSGPHRRGSRELRKPELVELAARRLRRGRRRERRQQQWQRWGKLGGQLRRQFERRLQWRFERQLRRQFER